MHFVVQKSEAKQAEMLKILIAYSEKRWANSPSWAFARHEPPHNDCVAMNIQQGNSTGKAVGWEAHLIERAQAGEAVAFELLADMHRTALFNLAMRMLRNGDDANDAVQDTFVKAMRAIKDFDPSRPLRPWLSRICTNCCVDAVRNRRRDGGSLDSREYALSDDSQDLDRQVSGNCEFELVRDAVNKLPRRYREIVMMRHFRHMDVLEIAEALQKPEGTIKSWLFRARALLKKDLQVALG